MNKRDFTIAELRELGLPYACTWKQVIGSGRWVEHWEGIFEHDGKTWLLEWQEGLTELQDSVDPWDFDPVEVYEAEAYEHVETRWCRKEAA